MSKAATCSSWRRCRLDELGFVGRGKSRHRPRNDPSLYCGPYPFIQTADIMASEFRIRSYSKTYNDKGLAQSKLWTEETLCLTIAGENTGESAILDFPACFPDSIVGFVPDRSISDIAFIKYSLDLMKSQFKSVSRGATQDNLSLDKLLSFELLIPSIEVQHRIASILSAYDDLIENNTRRIAILEEMAWRLYEEWFVKFRFPGHEGVELVEDGDFGTRPNNWERKTLQDYVELAYGKALKADDRVDGPYPVYGSSGAVGSHNTYLVEGPGIIVGRKGNVGSIFLEAKPFYPIDTVYYVKTDLPLEYVYNNLKKQNFINNDAAVPGLNRNQAYSLPFLRPADDILRSFQDRCAPLYGMARLLDRTNANLRAQRDLLLPKLISGEIDVSQVPELEAAAA